MEKSPSFEHGLKKGPWTSEEDQKLICYIEEHGHRSWRTLPLKAGLQRCGKSCRLRWRNYLRPDIKRGKFSLQEEKTIVQLHALLGNRWSAIATHMPRRTDNKIKNYWNTQLSKRLIKMGIDPVTHKPKTTGPANLSHMTQWENARLEAEARLCRSSSGFTSEPYQHASTPSDDKSLVQCFFQPKLQCLDVLQAWKNFTSSKQSFLKKPQTTISTINYFENSLSSLSNIQNRSMPVANQVEIAKPSSIMNMNKIGCMGGSKILKEPFHILDVSKQELEFEVIDILDQDNYMTEALTCPLTGVTNNYWSQILENLGNNSSLSSIF